MIIKSFCQNDTFELGKRISNKSESGSIYCLKGDLGVGKTVFTKGFAKGLGITQNVTSPTFTILNIYEGRLPLYHFDVYKINELEEMYDIGYEEMFFGYGVCLIEWAEKIKELIPEFAVWINIKKDFSKGENYRIINVEGLL